ncbi:MAG: adenylosuccinate lyase [Planctomycetes bacterium]|nr:adenylosuccinate lyase [Planctomycetota bacterium]
MTDRGDRFDHPLIERYASREMARLFSPRARHGTWRDLWIALAKAQHAAGFPVAADQIADLERVRDTFDWDRVAALEKDLRHDVMAHVHHYGELAPKARSIIHLGATSCFVTDNADLVLYRKALRLVEARLVAVLRALATFAAKWRDEPCLGYTHFQVAQPVTVGKRACLWAQDIALDLDEVRRIADWLPFRGVKGTTGTQATFLTLAGGDHRKVADVDLRVAEAMDFSRVIPVSGQTYTRKIDWSIHQVLSAVAQSASKFGADMRLLSHESELEEPSEEKQIGSSAMAYKKNPMRCERACSLARYVIEAANTTAHTAATQWLERSLDDSAIRRIAIPESFLAIDGVLMLMENVVRGMVVYPKVIQRKLTAQLPFLATEEILMAGVQKGGDRQDLHERVRVHSRAAAQAIKVEGRDNPLLDLIAADPAFAAIRDDLPDLLDPMRFVGRAPQQVDEFIANEIEPRIAGAVDAGLGTELRV